ncbi:zinc finger protein 93 [Orussus abietinus]|uniref:zinc finger protein 93 n=1 Tax=Orussus abietinus TaxID=222816 RepID=UPI0006250545|nr:zinc finger protein 93 [Orussus abietinus]XP_012272258.1 zinc finger protein 93 [Orussus abietinus]XP_012272259.1 zinc finger protein 93 [Orussus abietinus]XP_023287805.1 zinc finger protein 93 [Orussus abietinus]
MMCEKNQTDPNTESEFHSISIKLSNLCRLCGNVAVNGIEIFSAKGIEFKLQDKISMHMPITVDSKDIMPLRICLNCRTKLEMTHSLVTACVRTDINIRKLLNIHETVEYANKFQSLIEHCSMQVDSNKCGNDMVDNESVPLISKNDEVCNIKEYNKPESLMISELEHVAVLSQHSELSNNIDMSNMEDLIINDETNDDTNANSLNEFETFTEIKNTKNNPTLAFSTNNDVRIDKTNPITYFINKKEGMFKNHSDLCGNKNNLAHKSNEILCAQVDCTDISEISDTISFNLNQRTCDVCKDTFDNEEIFQEHIIVHNKLPHELNSDLDIDETLVGNQTSNNMNDQAKLKTSDLNVPNRRCGYCQAIFSVPKELQIHISEYHGEQVPFKCSLCDKTYQKWSNLDVHEATHRLDKPYLCDLCGKSFKHSNNLRGHKRTHLDVSKKKRHVCDICGNAYRSRFHLREHMNQHDGNKPYPCEECGKAFYKRIQLRQHKLSHGLNKYACPVCGMTFNRRGNMNAHLKRHNNREGTYACSVCEYRCSSMSELKLHRKQHSETDIIESIKKKSSNKTVWQCEVCARVFSKRAALLNHERIHTGDKVRIECDICGKKLASKSSLAYHKKSIHSNERPHMCQYCGESYVSKEARLIHERVHTGERPYVCKICNMRYRCSSNLSQHMKIHSEVRPHACSYCNKSFARKSALSVHERIHTGIKPFACLTCNKTFAQKNDMLKHTKTRHSKSIQCEQCDEKFSTKRDILKHMAKHDHESFPESSKGPTMNEFEDMSQQLETYTLSLPCIPIESSTEPEIVHNTE